MFTMMDPILVSCELSALHGLTHTAPPTRFAQRLEHSKQRSPSPFHTGGMMEPTKAHRRGVTGCHSAASTGFAADNWPLSCLWTGVGRLRPRLASLARFFLYPMIVAAGATEPFLERARTLSSSCVTRTSGLVSHSRFSGLVFFSSSPLSLRRLCQSHRA